MREYYKSEWYSLCVVTSSKLSVLIVFVCTLAIVTNVFELYYQRCSNLVHTDLSYFSCVCIA